MEQSDNCTKCGELIFGTPLKIEEHKKIPIDKPLQKGFVYKTSLDNVVIILDDGKVVSGTSEKDIRESYEVHTINYQAIIFDPESVRYFPTTGVNSRRFRREMGTRYEIISLEEFKKLRKKHEAMFIKDFKEHGLTGIHREPVPTSRIYDTKELESLIKRA